tara:strand:+ start:2401 stop:2634 length:234 start_codon:yes stop_codon:yes gene_type:complete
MGKEISYSGFVRSDNTEPEEKEYVERVAVFMSEDMLKTIIEDYDYWSHQLSHDAESFVQSHNYKVIADNLREYSDES